MRIASWTRTRLAAIAGIGAVLASAAALFVMAVAPSWVRSDNGWALMGGGFATLVIAAAGIRHFDMMKKLREAQASERRIARTLSDIVEISNDVYIEFDASLRVADVSARIESMTGQSRDGLRGLTVEQLRGDPAESEGRAVFWQAVVDRQPFRDVFAPITFPGGARFWVKGNGVPIFRDDGEFAGYRCMIFRMPDTEVRGSSQVNQDRMRALGQLAGGIAHDFNNLLASILGFSSLLKEDLKEDDPRHALVQRVLSAANRAKDLVQRIHSFARGNQGSVKNISIGETVDAIVPLLRASLPASTKLEIVKNVSGEKLRIDPARLENMLINLCANANEALDGDDGTVSLTVTPADPRSPAFQMLATDEGLSPERYSVMRRLDGADRILIGHVEPERTYMQLTVADNGHGIDSKILSRIFDPYFTTKASGTRVGKGGLGLSIVHGVVLNAGGALVLSTSQDRGTVVDIFLPLSETQDAGQFAATAGKPATSGRVLVVDDDAAVREFAAMSLRRCGLTIVPAANGAEALALFEADPDSWGAVVTDHGMPIMRGEALVRRIKEISPETPCLLCTGFSDTVTEESASRSGADAFLTKPLSPDLLQSMVVHLIAVRRAECRA